MPTVKPLRTSKPTSKASLTAKLTRKREERNSRLTIARRKYRVALKAYRATIELGRPLPELRRALTNLIKSSDDYWRQLGEGPIIGKNS